MCTGAFCRTSLVCRRATSAHQPFKMKTKSRADSASSNRDGNKRVGSSGSGSAPWAWTHNHDMEYWPPAGRSRAEAIAEGKRRGYKTFWIAQTRRMTEDEKEEYDGSWMVDLSTEESISPNVAGLP